MNTRAIMLFVFGAILLYGFMEAIPLLRGPSLSVSAPQPGEMIPGGIVEVSGTVARASALNLNGAPVLPSQTGAFATTLTLPKGVSVLTFVGTDSFGRITRKERTVFIP